MVPGIDFAGTVEESASAEFRPGDAVVVTGAGAGETAWGGYARVCSAGTPSLWCALPPGISLQQSMAIGTAGFTAMQSVIALERHGLTAGRREVLVTGAAGGVGSVAVAILAKLGYRVAASTGRAGVGRLFARAGRERNCGARIAHGGVREEGWNASAGTARSTAWADRRWPGFCPRWRAMPASRCADLAGGAAFSSTVSTVYPARRESAGNQFRACDARGTAARFGNACRAIFR